MGAWKYSFARKNYAKIESNNISRENLIFVRKPYEDTVQIIQPKNNMLMTWIQQDIAIHKNEGKKKTTKGTKSNGVKTLRRS